MFDISIIADWLHWNLRRKGRPARYVPLVRGLEDRYLLSTFQEFPLPALPRDPTDQYHRDRITTGPDGNLWFTDGVYGFGNPNEYVGRISPDGSVTEFSVDNNTSTQLYNITTGPDGNLWMLAIRTPNGTNDDQLVVIQMTPDGNYSVFGAYLGHSGEDFVSNVSPLVVGSDGNLWYTASFYAGFLVGSIVGRITPTGDVTNFNVAGEISQSGIGGGITAGADGNLWIGIGDGTMGVTPGVRRISPDGQLSDVIPRSQPLSEMVTDANGNVWGLVWTDHIERITPDGTVTDFALPVHQPVMSPTPELDPLRMTLTVGPDGNIWFSDSYANQIGNIAPDGTVTAYAVPTPDSFPAGITTGPDGNIWFTELGSGQIGELVLNDGGSGPTAEPSQSAGLPQAVRSAAVDALFGSAQADSPNPVGVNQQRTLATLDAAFSTNRLEEVSAPKAQQGVADAGMIAHQHQEERVGAAAVGLADPLAN
jgi:virginiamycin B lyase